MNSNENTWNDFVNNDPNLKGKSCSPIVAGVISPTALTQIADAFSPSFPSALNCYRIQFGSYDKSSGRVGLEGVTATTSQSGDFSTFDTLGKEVKIAIAGVQSAYSKKYGDLYAVKMALVGHSRGGLAARAFLQEPQSNSQKASIVTLLTTGTPHAGSHLGRVYNYLQNSCMKNGKRSGCKDDWQVVDFLNGLTSCNALSSRKNPDPLDVRRPTINDLSVDSASIKSIADTRSNFLSPVKYGTLAYSGTNMGRLNSEYGIFDVRGSIDWCDQVSTAAQTAILGGNNTPATFAGDGIVSETNQTFRVSNSQVPVDLGVQNRVNVFHADEPKQQAHINQALKKLLPNWNLK